MYDEYKPTEAWEAAAYEEVAVWVAHVREGTAKQGLRGLVDWLLDEITPPTPAQHTFEVTGVDERPYETGDYLRIFEVTVTHDPEPIYDLEKYEQDLIQYLVWSKYDLAYPYDVKIINDHTVEIYSSDSVLWAR
jgi:hypothetical protein